MKFELTRSQIVKALKTESLKNGNWIHVNELNEKFKNNTQCPVCAVGAILDMGIGKDMPPCQLNDLAAEMVMEPSFPCRTFEDGSDVDAGNRRHLTRKAKELIKEQNYLSALSGLYEGLSNLPGMKTRKNFANAKLRGILVNFVQKNFPSKLKINTDNYY